MGIISWRLSVGCVRDVWRCWRCLSGLGDSWNERCRTRRRVLRGCRRLGRYRSRGGWLRRRSANDGMAQYTAVQYRGARSPKVRPKTSRPSLWLQPLGVYSGGAATVSPQPHTRSRRRRRISAVLTLPPPADEACEEAASDAMSLLPAGARGR